MSSNETARMYALEGASYNSTAILGFECDLPAQTSRPAAEYGNPWLIADLWSIGKTSQN